MWCTVKTKAQARTIRTKKQARKKYKEKKEKDFKRTAGDREIFAPFKLVLEPTEPPIQWVPDLFLGGVAAGVWL